MFDFNLIKTYWNQNKYYICIMENFRGGKRVGAGRKSVGEKKFPMTFYFKGNDRVTFGSEEVLRRKIYEFVNTYGEAQVKNTPAEFEGYKLPPNQEEQPKGNYFAPAPVIPTPTEYESFINEVNESNTNDELEKTMLFVKRSQALLLKQKLYLEALAKKVFADKGFYKE